jgi:hypothetical protein
VNASHDEQTMIFSRRRGLAAVAGTGLALAVGSKLAAAQDATADASTASATTPAGAAVWLKYTLNTITGEQILAIPSAGDRMTREFAEYRPYTTIGQFRAEIGKYVDEGVVSGYEQYVFVPIDPTTPDADMFQQLPGLDADTAAQLADGGPYADDAAFLTALGGLVSADVAALAPAFLLSAQEG